MQCVEHGLATAPDGRCVLCRRVSTPAASARRVRPSLLIALALTGICLVVVLAMGREKPVPITESGSLLTTKLESESVDQAADPAVPVQRTPHATPPTIGA